MVEGASPLSVADRQTLADAGRVWWLFLVTGTLWLLFSIIVFRFDYTTVSAISILFGILMLAAAVMEAASVFLTHGWRRLGHGVLAVALLVIAIVSFRRTTSGGSASPSASSRCCSGSGPPETSGTR